MGKSSWGQEELAPQRLGCRRVAELGVLATPVCWRNLCLPGKHWWHTPAGQRQRAASPSRGWVAAEKGAKDICSEQSLPPATPLLERAKHRRASKSLPGAVGEISGPNPASLGLWLQGPPCFSPVGEEVPAAQLWGFWEDAKATK